MIPLVSIITLQYGHFDVTIELLKSLRNITYPNVEIIVVDNGSTDFNPNIILTEFTEINLIESETNLGFAGGNNLGIKQAKGKYILLLNNDTEVESNFLEPLVEKMENDKSIGIVCPKIKFYHSKDTLQFVGYDRINPITQRGGSKGYGEKDIGQYNVDKEASYGHGAAMMLPIDVIKEVGLMPDIYFLYYEELDWSHRIRTAGYKIYYVHNSLVWHKESISTGGKVSPLKTYYMIRNRILFLRRNFFGITFFLAFLYQTFIVIPKTIIIYLFLFKLVYFSASQKAIFWHLIRLFNKSIHINPKY